MVYGSVGRSCTCLNPFSCHPALPLLIDLLLLPPQASLQVLDLLLKPRSSLHQPGDTSVGSLRARHCRRQFGGKGVARLNLDGFGTGIGHGLVQPGFPLLPVLKIWGQLHTAMAPNAFKRYKNLNVHRVWFCGRMAPAALFL